MIVLHLASVLVSLLSFSAAAPTTDNCSQPIQHLTPNDLHQILGRWILIEGFANTYIFGLVFENVESVWLTLSTTADNNTLLLDQGNRLVPQPHLTSLKDRCLRAPMNVTLVDGEALEFYIPNARSNNRFLQTCPDCLLMHTYHKENSHQMLYLLGRNMTLPDSDLKTFRKQAECLQFPQPAKFHYDTNKELCPE